MVVAVDGSSPPAMTFRRNRGLSRAADHSQRRGDVRPGWMRRSTATRGLCSRRRRALPFGHVADRSPVALHGGADKSRRDPEATKALGPGGRWSYASVFWFPQDVSADEVRSGELFLFTRADTRQACRGEGGE